MIEEEENDKRLAHYLKIGAISLEGMDENGEIIYSINEIAKEIAPELWKSHMEYIDHSLMQLYQDGLAEVEYDENLEATFHLTEEGTIAAKAKGLIEFNFNTDIPND